MPYSSNVGEVDGFFLLVRRQPFWQAVLHGVFVRLHDATDRLRPASPDLYVSSLAAVLAETLERYQAIDREVRESVLQPVGLIRLRFGSLSLSTMSLAVAFGFRPRFDVVSCSFMNSAIVGVSLRFLPDSRLATPLSSMFEVFENLKLAIFQDLRFSHFRWLTCRRGIH